MSRMRRPRDHIRNLSLKETGTKKKINASLEKKETKLKSKKRWGQARPRKYKNQRHHDCVIERMGLDRMGSPWTGIFHSIYR